MFKRKSTARIVLGMALFAQLPLNAEAGPFFCAMRDAYAPGARHGLPEHGHRIHDKRMVEYSRPGPRCRRQPKRSRPDHHKRPSTK
jgi:hypothetical protein